jgi:hypothetical protein
MGGPVGTSHVRVRRVPSLVVVLLVTSLVLPAALVVAQALEATLVDVKGEVEWSPAGATQWQRAGVATVLHAGDRVRTAANSSARLAYHEGTTTDLAATTGIRLDDLSQTAAGNNIKLLQVGGVSQGKVAEQAAPTNYEVESPASVASAPAGTCPWVRVAPSGTTLVRNYLDSAVLAVEPQQVQELRHFSAWMPTPFGPRLTQRAELMTTTRLIPVTPTVDEQPLLPCPGPSASALPATDTLAHDSADGSLRLLSAEALVAGGALQRVQAQGPGRNISVRNTSGAQIQTVSVGPGQESQIVPGEAPSAPVPIGTFAARAAAFAASSNAQRQAQNANQGNDMMNAVGQTFGQAAAQQAASNFINQAIQQQLQPRAPQVQQQPSQVQTSPTAVPTSPPHTSSSSSSSSSSSTSSCCR